MPRPFDPRNRRTLALAAMPALALAVYVYWPSAAADEAVELTSPGPAVASPPPAAPPPEDQGRPAAVPAASAAGLRLHGLLAGGAIIAMADGTQRFVAIGRQVLPGLTLQEIRQHHAVLLSASGPIEIGFAGPKETEVAGRNEGAHAGARTASANASGSRRKESLQYRLGLAPRRTGGRISGFTIRPGADLPHLQQAGLQAGDVLLSVNGQAFRSEERVLELAEEIGTSYTAEFVFERNGRRMQTSLKVQPKT